MAADTVYSLIPIRRTVGWTDRIRAVGSSTAAPERSPGGLRAETGRRAFKDIGVAYDAKGHILGARHPAKGLFVDIRV